VVQSDYNHQQHKVMKITFMYVMRPE
jgi:hypothetical protein